jgi:hypothetical protein
MTELVVGRIYFWKDRLIRIFSYGGAGFHSGRGCKNETAIPYNHIRAEDCKYPTFAQINYFLEQEMANGMCQTINKKLF